MSEFAIIGSGLAAISAAKALVLRGVKPVILDCGEQPGQETSALISRLSQTNPEQWTAADLDLAMENSSTEKKDALPRKLSFGSDYFYGKSKPYALVEEEDSTPPFSFAKGGFSVGWGASALPPNDCDLQAWPLKTKDLKKYYRTVLSGVPYSAKDDGLSRHFPLFSDSYKPLKLTDGKAALIRTLEKCSYLKINTETVAFGQARLMTSSHGFSGYQACKYCGCCTSGCPYGSIFQADLELDKMIAAKQVEYQPNIFVKSLEEKDDEVQVLCASHDGSYKRLAFKRVFLAAGAVNSTRIIMESKKIFDREIAVLGTSGFVLPMFQFRRVKIRSILGPNTNTQPGAFLQFKAPDLSDHWIHTQLSTPNKLVFQKLQIDLESNNVIQIVKRLAVEHLVVAHCNMHSDHSNPYMIKLRAGSNGASSVMTTRRERRDGPHHAVKLAARRLFMMGLRIGFYGALPLIQKSIDSVGYHLGGSLPMQADPQKDTDTDLMGTPTGYSKVHVVDSSVFPSLPGTTIGLLAMANATRIASEVEL